MSGSAVPGPVGSIDSDIPWHYGDPHREQRLLAAGEAVVDLSNRGVLTVCGSDRLGWLNDLTSQLTLGLTPGQSTEALILDPHGHVEHDLHLVDDGECTWITVEPGSAEAVASYLERMKFMRNVTVTDVSGSYGVIWIGTQTQVEDGQATAAPRWLVPPEFAGLNATDSGSDRGGDASRYAPIRPAAWRGQEVILPLAQARAFLQEAPELAGSWAWDALRVAAAVPRVGADTDHKTLPHEVGWIGPAVHLSKGCYRGQETVARVHNLGRPPRRLVLLHLDGSLEEIPARGDEVLQGERVVGWVGSVARHYELGPIALATVKRSIPVDAELVIRRAGDGLLISASQEVVVVG